MDESEGFWVQVPSDGRLFAVGMRVRLRKNGDGETVISDPEGDLVIVNFFPDDEAHTNFGRNLGGPLEAVGLSGPELEHLEVLKVEWR